MGMNDFLLDAIHDLSSNCLFIAITCLTSVKNCEFIDDTGNKLYMCYLKRVNVYANLVK